MERLWAALCVLLLTSGCVSMFAAPNRHTGLPRTCFENQQAELREIAGPLADRKVEYWGRTTSTDFASPPEVKLEPEAGKGSCVVSFEAGEQVAPGTPRSRQVRVGYYLKGTVPEAREELGFVFQHAPHAQEVDGLGDNALSWHRREPSRGWEGRAAVQDSNLLVVVTVSGYDGPVGEAVLRSWPREQSVAGALLIARAEASR